ncbi:hypothetical protein DXG03_009256 [Asterophora parasitica]|uniref:Uncharacterized protein n=1 Tax=Asterophora parasitica TaxID=117018 RepID=A0A9P7G3V1_9AGAR|nr:hypothetical protein DXG03_009256 [Asterophora parasitica]
MSSSLFSDKRTRSQLTLPDALLFQLPQGSPMKNAQTAAKNNNDTGPSMDVRTRVETPEETDDELLLSPRKVVTTTRTSKRSVSPPPEDEYSARPVSLCWGGRELKRQKRDGGNDDSVPDGAGPNKNPLAAIRSNHIRSLSQPEATRKSTRARSGTNSGSGTPAPANPDPDTSTMSEKGRAQSVPLFPSSSASSVLRIDLRNPPASPRRPRSRSPSKERELRIVAAPSVTKLDTILDEAVSDMHVDEDPVHEALKPHTTFEAAVLNTLDIPIPDNNVLRNPIEQLQPLETTEPTPTTQSASIPVIHEPPSTPVSEQFHVPMPPLSPLTPLPETPHPSKFATSAENRYTGIAWGSNIEEEDEVRSGVDLRTRDFETVTGHGGYH